MSLELLGLILLALGYFVWKRENLTVGVFGWLVALICLPVIYLVPLPTSIWELLPGTSIYVEILNQLPEKTSFHAITLYSGASLDAWVALIPVIAVFLFFVNSSYSQLIRLVYVVLAIAVFQSLLGLLQYTQGSESLLRFGMTGHADSGIGTYPNRNHLAGFLEMFLPLALMFFFVSVSQFAHSKRGRFAKLAVLGNMRSGVLFVVSVLLLLGIVFTRSRTGLALGMFGVLLTAFLLLKLRSLTMVRKTTLITVVIVFTCAAEIGLLPVFERLANQNPLSDSRWTLFASTWEGIRYFLPFGSGPGTFPYIYPRFQVPEITGFVNYAHNDYLQWLFEMGMGGGLLLLTAIWLFIMQWQYLWKGTKENPHILVQLSCGVGIILLLLHSLVDFNLRIPANSIYFSMLCGIFFRIKKEN